MIIVHGMDMRFDSLVIDVAGHRLLREGREVALGKRAYDLLRYFAERPGRLITKEELLRAVWKTESSSVGTISNTVAKLRRALGQPADEKYPIETVHGRGYRFKAGTASSPSPPSASTPSPHTPFVGRAATLELLLERLAKAGGGDESVVVLFGEAGIGKTRLVREFSDRARDCGALVLQGTCFEGGGAPPYWPWVQILKTLRDRLPEEQWSAHVLGRLHELAPLVPEDDAGARAKAGEPEPQAARVHLFEEVARLLGAISAQRCMLIAIDDVHDADLGSLELLEFAARALRHSPVLFTATLRSGETEEEGEGHVALKLGRLGSFVQLAGLSEPDVRDLTLAILGERRLEPNLVHELHARTRGNPLYVCQLLELLDQRPESGAPVAASDAGELPPAIKYVIRRRLARLAPASRTLLRAASVVGASFEPSLLAEVTSSGVLDVLGALEPAVRDGLLENVAPDQIAFAHALTRDALYEELGIRERGELHARTAHALSRRQQPEDRFRLAATACHYLKAFPFEVPSAIAACRSAAAAARDASEFGAAARFLQELLGRLDAEGAEGTLRIPVLLDLGESHFCAGMIASAWNAFRAAADAAHCTARPDLLAKVASRLVDCLALGVGDLWFAREMIQAALRHQERLPASIRAGLMAQHAELDSLLNPAERSAALTEAARLAAHSGEPEAILEVAYYRAILRDPTAVPENLAAVDDFFMKLREYPLTAASMPCRSLRRFGAHLTHYLNALSTFNLTDAEVALEECQRIADSSHIIPTRMMVQLMLAGRALAEGRLDDLRELLPVVDPRSSTEIPSEGRAWAAYTAAWLEARGKLDTKAALCLATGPRWELAPSRHSAYVAIGRARMYSVVGDRERARMELRNVPDAELARMPVRYGDLGALCALADTYCARRDLERAEWLYAKLQPYAERNAVGPRFEYYGAVAYYMGSLAALLGRSRSAHEHFMRALALNRRLKMPLQVARIERALSSADSETSAR